MVRRSNSAALRCEALEARDVPAIVLAAGFTQPTPTTTDIAPLGGTVTVTEIQLVSTNPLRQRNNAVAPGQTKLATASDSITFNLSDTTLTISSADGIFGRATNALGNQVTVTYGNTLTINNVTGLNVQLQLGGNDTVALNGTAAFAPTMNSGPGNDSVADNTPLATALDGGPGNDTVTAAGGAVDPALIAFLFQQVQNLTPDLLSMIAGTGPTKLLIGGDDDDTITVKEAASRFTLNGGAGNDTLFAPTGLFNGLVGGAGDDTLVGSLFGFFDTLDGDAGNDIIVGGFGPDVIIGGTGRDTLFGQGGRDFYLAVDIDPDAILNVPGDLVGADDIDFVAFS